MSLRKALLAATIFSLPIAAQAQLVRGVYIGAGAGVNWLESSEFTNTFVTTPQSTGNMSVDFQTGFAGLVSVGYGFGNGLRVEGEVNYRSNNVDSITAPGRFAYGTGGVASTLGFMVNVLYDFRLGSVMPYIGGGVGYGLHNYSSVSFRGFQPGTTTNLNTIIDDDDGQFAYQAILGLAVPVGLPGLAFTFEGRFFGTTSSELTAVTRNVVTGAQVGTSKAEVDNMNWSVLVGLRYNFGQAAPAPVPAPAAAPAPARTFLVFFDFDRADLTDRARQIIAEAAQTRGRVQTTRIEVNGHADRAGSPQYNQRLSERRAAAVAAELVRLGVPRNEIVTRGFGETVPLVPTADGVREPQNRRVEIILR